MASLFDPAFGKVKATVVVDAESSVTTVTPLGRVVTETLLALLGCGDVKGILERAREVKYISETNYSS